VQANPSGEDGADCAEAYVWFTEDGHLDYDDYQRTKASFPGCFD
jgi:hypothetical protein